MEENVFSPSNTSDGDVGDLNEENGPAFSEKEEDSKYEDGKRYSCTAHCSSYTGQDIQVTQQDEAPLNKNFEQSDVSACFPVTPAPLFRKSTPDLADEHRKYDLSIQKPQSDSQKTDGQHFPSKKADRLEDSTVPHKREESKLPVEQCNEGLINGQTHNEFPPAAEPDQGLLTPESEEEDHPAMQQVETGKSDYGHDIPPDTGFSKAFNDDRHVTEEEDVHDRILQSKCKVFTDSANTGTFEEETQPKHSKHSEAATEPIIDVAKKIPLLIPTKPPNDSGAEPFIEGIVTETPVVGNKATRDSVRASNDREDLTDDVEDQPPPTVHPPVVVQNNGSACLTPDQSPNQASSDVLIDNLDAGCSSLRTFDMAMDDNRPRLLTSTQDRLQQDHLRLLVALFAVPHTPGRTPLDVVPPQRHRYGIREAQHGSPHSHEERCLRCRKTLSSEEADDENGPLRHRCQDFVCAMCKHLRDNTRWRWTCPRCNAPICLLCNWEDHQCPEPCACCRGCICRGRPPGGG